MGKYGRNDLCSCGSNKKYKLCCIKNKVYHDNTGFFLDETYYYKTYFPIYNSSGFVPNLLVQFLITLPYAIPFVDGMCHLMNFKDFAISFRFNEIAVDEGYKYGVLKDEGVINRYLTKVEMTYATNLSFDMYKEQNKKFLNEFFDVLLLKLNLLVSAYQILKKDIDVHYLTKEMLQMSIITRIIPIKDWNKQEFNLFMVHTNIPYKKERITYDDQAEIIRHCEIIEQEINPFVLAENFILNSKRFFNSGYYLESIIYAQTGVETFIRALYKEFLIDEDVTTSDIINILEDTPFMSIIKKEMPKRLGGVWDITREDCEVYKWYNSTYLLRNKVVHSGYIPNYIEADVAIFQVIELRYYIKKLLDTKNKKYPLISAYFTFKE